MDNINLVNPLKQFWNAKIVTWVGPAIHMVAPAMKRLVVVNVILRGILQVPGVISNPLVSTKTVPAGGEELATSVLVYADATHPTMASFVR